MAGRRSSLARLAAAGAKTSLGAAVLAALVVALTVVFGPSPAEGSMAVLSSEPVAEPASSPAVAPVSSPVLTEIGRSPEPSADELAAALAGDLARIEAQPAREVEEPAPEEPRPVTEGPTAPQPGVVYLTFDDGPDPTFTPAILDVLARYDAKATFFVLGSSVQAHPELFARIVAEGHTIGNHSWNHEDLTTLNQEQFNDNILRTQAELGAHGTSCLRPPFGAADANTRAWAADLGLELVLWDVDTNDWQKPGADVITQRIVDGAESGGSTILLHDGGGDRTQTLQSLEVALAELSSRGLRFEPVC